VHPERLTHVDVVVATRFGHALAVSPPADRGQVNGDRALALSASRRGGGRDSSDLHLEPELMFPYQHEPRGELESSYPPDVLEQQGRVMWRGQPKTLKVGPRDQALSAVRDGDL